MRRRKIKDGVERLLSHREWLVEEPEELRGMWSKEGMKRPVHLEIGTGKGKFITTLAKDNPDHYYLGLEMKEEVLLRAVEKAIELKLSNIRFLWKNARQLEEFFDQREIYRIYLNFSDPWPKKRWAKRRLTHENFLRTYRMILDSHGEIHLRTDNQGFFQDAINRFSGEGFQLKNVDLDLYKNRREYSEESIFRATTEYEDKFNAQGLPIYRLEAKPYLHRVSPLKNTGQDEEFQREAD